MRKLSLGLELEMPVVCKATGSSYPVVSYFDTLYALKKEKNAGAEMISMCGRPLEIRVPKIVSGVDNAYNNLESAFGPLYFEQADLNRLYDLVCDELQLVFQALDSEGATVVNFSQHPDVRLTPEYYKNVCCPKPIYEYWVGYRGWSHHVGVDAKAHNGPTTGIAPGEAVRALNLLLRASSAFIAFFANSPFEGGEVTGFMENRLHIWERMFQSACYPCDRKLHVIPERPFRDLKDYFLWMFGPGTNMQFVVSRNTKDYKKPGCMYLIAGDPPLLEFLQGKSWPGRVLGKSDEHCEIHPSMRHFEFLQFCQFIDARIRYGFSEEPSVEDFLTAWERKQGLERFFEETAAYCYIEGRVSGANFPDAELADLGGNIAESVVLSPSALQAGLLRNLSRAEARLGKYAWQDLLGLRSQAIRHGIRAEYNGISVEDVCRDVLECAGEGLEAEEHWAMSYAEHVLCSKMNGADRALAAYDATTGDPHERSLQLVRDRLALLPGRGCYSLGAAMVS